MLRRLAPLLAVGVAVASWVGPVGSGGQRPAAAVPVATSDLTYSALGRVFPDPMGCRRGLPGSSPWAKGNVCATQFLQWQDTLNGLRYLQSKHPRFVELVNLHDLKANVPEFADLDMQSAGLPNEDLTRDRRDLYVLVVTDRDSPVALADRKRYAYSLSIHGIERAGIEGGIRAAEDLVTWAATAPNTRILEPTNSGPAAGDVLRQSVLYFVFSNPDGWHRGEVSKGGIYYQRYNGNGTDLNREFPHVGFLNPIYTPAAEPEAQGYAAYLQRERALAGAKPFRGAMDLHGMNAAPSFSYTMLPGGKRSYQKNTDMVRVARTVYDDAIKRLSWSPLIAPPEDCPGDIPIFLFVASGNAPMCADQWGTVWDTINYQTTGSIQEWSDGELGLDAVGLGNEMAYSHITTNTNFIPEIEQLHVDGNKGLIFGQLASLHETTRATFPLPGATGFVPAVRRFAASYSGVSAAAELPAQAPLDLRELRGGGIEFTVNGPEQGVQNEGLTAEFTFTNVDGISTDSFSEVVLQRFGIEHAGETEGWHDVGAWYRQEPTYMPGGARIDINHPRPGRYRLEPHPARFVATQMRVTFKGGPAIPKRIQGSYDVANTDAIRDLRPSLANPGQLTEVSAAQILSGTAGLPSLSTLVLADDPAPGVPAASRKLWFERLGNWVNSGGNLVLTDRALTALVDLGIVPEKAVIGGVHYGGWVSFTDAAGATTFGKHPLTAGLDLPGAANGRGSNLVQRRQTYDPAAVGYYVSESAGNGSCNNDRCDAPQWIVDHAAWKKAGGSVAGQSVVLLGKDGSDPERVGVGLGEVPYGAGRIRIAGALLPTATEANNHPYGLSAHGLSYTGYQLLVNLLDARPRVVAGLGGVSRIPATSATPTELPLTAVAVTLALLARRARRFWPADSPR